MQEVVALILGIIQGLTEFLPVSSSGHLSLGAIISEKLNIVWSEPLFFNVMVHLATLIVVVVFLKDDILTIIKGIFSLDKRVLRLCACVIIATLPAVFVGFFAKEVIEDAMKGISSLSIAFLFTSILLGTTQFIYERKESVNNKDDILELVDGKLPLLESIIIGLFQAVAIFPGVSRSGSTICAALFCGFSREQSFRFSFLLSLPVIFGAGLLEALEAPAIENKLPLIIGFIAALISGYFGLKILAKLVRNLSLWGFVIYTGSLSVILSAINPPITTI